MDFPLLGIPEIDDQHRGLVNNLEQLRFWRDKGQGFAAALNALQTLGQYVQTHFQDEEAFMRQHGYPKLEQHIAKHQEIVRNLGDIYQHVLSGEDITDETMCLLTTWVVEHIGEADLDIATYIRGCRN